ncbi:MAG TPA: hypothetical protein VFI70_10380 [Nitrososphaeraceae archaeon]|nr:hypothetical protein [Nitrososphaeraceae archaeon]
MQKEQPHIHSLAAYGIIGVMIRQYEGKSYRMFSEWLVEEAYYLRTFLQLSHVPHFTPLQNFTERISGTLLGKIISSFIILTTIRWNRFVWIQSNLHFSVLCRKSRTKEKKIH